eukprot:gene13638-16118_t
MPEASSAALAKSSRGREKVASSRNALGGIDHKLKASNFSAIRLQIGSWDTVSRFVGDLVSKFYFAKRKLVWEILDRGLKSKIEIQWSDICALKATMPPDLPGTLEVVLSRPPLFFKETNPQPRKHTLWQAAGDFTGSEATLCKPHLMVVPPGVLNKHWEKLLQCDARLKALAEDGLSSRIPQSLHLSSTPANVDGSPELSEADSEERSVSEEEVNQDDELSVDETCRREVLCNERTEIEAEEARWKDSFGRHSDYLLSLNDPSEADHAYQQPEKEYTVEDLLVGGEDTTTDPASKSDRKLDDMVFDYPGEAAERDHLMAERPDFDNRRRAYEAVGSANT